MSGRLSAVVCALVISAGCLGMGGVKTRQILSPTFGDLAAIKGVELTGESGEVLLRGTFTETKNSDGKIVRVATMTGDAPGPSGTTEIAIERSNGRSDEEVTIRVRDLPFPTLCRLMADGKELALFSTGMLDGNVELTFARRVIVADPGK
jgi:hypothetical protein